jgi:hypothetical protein
MFSAPSVSPPVSLRDRAYQRLHSTNTNAEKAAGLDPDQTDDPNDSSLPATLVRIPDQGE